MSDAVLETLFVSELPIGSKWAINLLKSFQKKSFMRRNFCLFWPLHFTALLTSFKKSNFPEIEFPEHLTQFPFKLHMWISWEEDMTRPLDLAETKEPFSHLKKVSLFGIFLQSNLHVLQPFLSIHFPWKKPFALPINKMVCFLQFKTILLPWQVAQTEHQFCLKLWLCN